MVMEPGQAMPGEMRSVYGRLRLKHLQLIAVVDRTGNLGKAASELNMTQSAASKILQDAEDIFASALFERSARGLAATVVGEHVIRYAQRALNHAAQVVSDVETLNSGGAGSIAIGAIMASTSRILPAALTELRRRRPYLVVHLNATTSDEIVALMDKGQIEIGLCRLTNASQGSRYDFEELFDEDYWIFAGSGHPLAGKPSVTLADLASQPWVVQPWPSPSRQVLDGEFARQGLSPPRSRVETRSRMALLQLVKHAGMIGLLPSTLLAEYVERGELVRLPIEALLTPSRYGLVTRRGEQPGHYVAEFAAIVRGMAQEDALAAE